jgi:hypothetical protein
MGKMRGRKWKAEELLVTGTLKACKDVTFETLNETLSKDDTFCRMNMSCPLIHFAGPGRRVYLVTASSEQSLSLRKYNSTSDELEMLGEE